MHCVESCSLLVLLVSALSSVRRSFGTVLVLLFTSQYRDEHPQSRRSAPELLLSLLLLLSASTVAVCTFALACATDSCSRSAVRPD